ncbi:MAG: pepsin/retropepsin-like aspartic protease family protein, partial [Polyangiaceae bacterium]
MIGFGRGLALVALALVSACQPAARPAPTDEGSSVARARTPPVEGLPQPLRRRQATIRFEDQAGRPFPYPIVDARVRGVPTRLVVDTGASHTVLDVWLLEQLGVQLVESEQPGEGHAGEKVATMRAHAPHLELEEWGAVPDDVLAVRLPPVFRTLGLGGVVSPQGLAGPGMVVILDLPASLLRSVPRDEGKKLGDSESLGAARPCRVGGDLGGVVYLVDGTVRGHPVRLVVDSGAARTDVLAQSAAGRLLREDAASGDTSYTVGGPVRGERVDDETLTVGRLA